MNTESRLRAALQNTAELVEDRPRPLPLARRRNPMAMFAPVWVAVAVTAVVIASFVIRDQSRLGDATPSSSPQAVSVGSAPKYYLAVYRATAGRASRFDVVSTATGEVLLAHLAGNNEDFVAATSVSTAGVVAKAGEMGVSSFYLLTRVGAGGSEGCGSYSIRDILISSEGKFLQWGTHDLGFEARDNEQMLLATTKAGDEIAYTYRDCDSGDQRIAHNWAVTATSNWGSDKPVTSLGYTPDGHSLVIGRQTGTKHGSYPEGELWIMKTKTPGFDSGEGRRLLAGSKDIAALYYGTISPDGKQVIAVVDFLPAEGLSTQFAVAEFSLDTGQNPRYLGGFERQAGDQVHSVDPDTSGQSMLIRSGNKIIIMKPGQPAFTVSGTVSDQPTDVAW